MSRAPSSEQAVPAARNAASTLLRLLWSLRWPLSLAPIALLALLHVPYPFGGDQAMFAYAARALSQGARLYAEYWDMKQPGIYWFYQWGGALFGSDAPGIHLLEWFWMMALAVVLIWLARAHLTNAWLAWLAPLFCLGTFYVNAGHTYLTQVEGLVNLPIAVFALCMLRKAATASGGYVQHSIAGAGAVLVAVFKLLLGLIPAAIWVAVIVHDLLNGRPWREVMSARVMPVVVGGLCVLAVVLTYFLAHGTAHAAWWTNVVYPTQALQEYTASPAARLLRAVRWLALCTWPLLLCSLPAIWRDAFRRDRLYFVVVATWIVAAAVAVGMQLLSWWIYHMLIFLVPIGLLGLRGVDVLVTNLESRLGEIRGRMSGAVVCSVVLAVALLPGLYRNVWSQWQDPPRPWTDLAAFQANVDPQLHELAQGASFLKAAGARDGRIVLLGDPRVVFLTQREPLIEVNGWTYYLRAQLEQAAQQLRQADAPYAYVSAYLSRLHSNGTDALYRALHDHYRPVATDGAGGTWYERAPQQRQ